MSSETITRNDLTNILNEVLPNTSVDYIVEQGTSGNWTYRKWNSGVAECWATMSSGAFAPTSTSSPISSRVLSVSFPTGLFNSAPSAHVDIYWGSGTSWASARSATKDDLGYVVFKLSTASESATLYMSAKGTWK